MVIIGDIHGCWKTFEKALDHFKGEKIGLVGDLIDRGNFSYDVVQCVMDNLDRIDCVRGNHEQMAIDWFDNRREDLWLANGGDHVIRQYQSMEKLEKHINFFKTLPFYRSYPSLELDDGRYLMLSHSIITNANIDLVVNNQAIIWGRYFPDKDPSNGEWFNVFGHTPTPYCHEDRQPLPYGEEWFMNIDCGAVYGGHLCALEFPKFEVTLFKPELADTQK